jgi:hypothetical protein
MWAPASSSCLHLGEGHEWIIPAMSIKPAVHEPLLSLLINIIQEVLTPKTPWTPPYVRSFPGIFKKSKARMAMWSPVLGRSKKTSSLKKHDTQSHVSERSQMSVAALRHGIKQLRRGPESCIFSTTSKYCFPKREHHLRMCCPPRFEQKSYKMLYASLLPCIQNG